MHTSRVEWKIAGNILVSICFVNLAFHVNAIYQDAVPVHPCEKEALVERLPTLSFVEISLKGKIFLANNEWVVLKDSNMDEESKHQPLLWIHGTLSEQEIFGKMSKRWEWKSSNTNRQGLELITAYATAVCVRLDAIVYLHLEDVHATQIGERKIHIFFTLPFLGKNKPYIGMYSKHTRWLLWCWT